MNGFAARQLAALAAFLFVLAAVPAGADDPPAAGASAPASSGSAGETDPADAASAAAKPASPDDAAPSRKDAAEPRHGERSKASDGTLLVYDKVVGAYRTTGHVATYWIDDRFWRFDDGVWTSAAANAGPWQVVSAHVVPGPARHQHSAPKSTTKMVLPSGREAVFEPRLKVHKVVGRKGVFLFDGDYYRYDGGVWFESQGDDGPWRPTSAKPLPPPLKRALPAPVHGDKVTMPSGETLVYDADSRLYDVEGRPTVVYFDGAFYERKEDRWMRSAEGSPDMEPVEVTAVPVPVRAKYHTPAGKKAASRKKGASQKTPAAQKKDPAQKKDAAQKKSAAKQGAGSSKKAATRQGDAASGDAASGDAAKPPAGAQPKDADSPPPAGD